MNPTPPQTSEKPYRATIWFPNEADRERFAQTLRVQISDVLRIENGNYPLELEVLCGPQRAASLANSDFKLVYLPSEGLGDRALFSRLYQEQRSSVLSFVRFFLKNELACHPNEPSPLKALWHEVRDSFSTSPFLAVIGEVSDDVLQQWFSDLKQLITLHREERDARTQMNKLSELCQDHLASIAEFPTPIDSVPMFEAAVKFCYRSRRLLESWHELQEQQDRNASLRDEDEESSSELARNAFEVSGKSVYGIDFVFDLGEELLSGLKQTLDLLKKFGKKLVDSEIDTISELGSSLLTRLEDRPPILALIGSFSSGKTTLLNTLLFAKQKPDWGVPRAFRTSTTANTAIVSELSACGADGKETVAFRLRNRIDHVLVDFREGKADASLDRNIKTLRALIEKGILISPDITCHFKDDARHKNPLRPVFKLRAKGKEKCLEYLSRLSQPSLKKFEGLDIEKIVQTGEVDQEYAKAYFGNHFPVHIDLSSDEGWRLFQGDRDLAKPIVETVEASFIFERAEVNLRHPLLDLTTVADTPGIGSRNDRHDIITAEYLARAEGYIVLLPTDVSHALRVDEMLKKVREACRDRHGKISSAGLDHTAFVVNCFSRQGDAAIRQRLDDYERRICLEFDVTENEWRSRCSSSSRNCFFAVDLKSLEKGRNYGELYDRPSFIPLKHWIRRLFCSGAYRQRLDTAIDILDKHWYKKIRETDDIAQDIAGSENERRRLADRIKTFREGVLQDEKLHTVSQIQGFKDDFGQDVTKTEDLLTRFVGTAADTKKEDLDQWESAACSHYSQLNAKFREFGDLKILEDWKDEIEEKLKNIQVPAPLMSTPSSYLYAGSFAWSPLESKFAEIKSSWPSWFGGRILASIRGAFSGEDPRRILARSLKEVWDYHRVTIWKDSVTMCLDGWKAMIDSYCQNVEIACRKKEQELLTLEDSQRQDKIGRARAEFSNLEPERKQILDSLEKELSQRGRKYHGKDEGQRGR